MLSVLVRFDERKLVPSASHCRCGGSISFTVSVPERRKIRPFTRASSSAARSSAEARCATRSTVARLPAPVTQKDVRAASEQHVHDAPRPLRVDAVGGQMHRFQQGELVRRNADEAVRFIAVRAVQELRISSALPLLRCTQSSGPTLVPLVSAGSGATMTISRATFTASR